jgi:hypothetical protein
MKIVVFWDVALCSEVDNKVSEELTTAFNHEDGDKMSSETSRRHPVPW